MKNFIETLKKACSNVVKYFSICEHEYSFLRNIYGDEIIERGWKRSLWKCNKCPKIIAKDELMFHSGSKA